MQNNTKGHIAHSLWDTHSAQLLFKQSRTHLGYIFIKRFSLPMQGLIIRELAYCSKPIPRTAIQIKCTQDVACKHRFACKQKPYSYFYNKWCAYLAHRKRWISNTINQANLGGDLVWLVEALGSQNCISMGQGMKFVVATLFP